jgi:hypothetical protein
MAVDGTEEPVLILVLERRERVGKGGRDPSGAEVTRARGREAPAQGHATGYPVRLVPEKTRHLELGEPVVVDQRADDLGLIEGGERPRRRVRLEQPALLIGDDPGALDDDGDDVVSPLEVAGEALEAVQDLVAAAVRRGRHAQRQICGIWQWARDERAGPQLSVAGPQRAHRHEADAPCAAAGGRRGRRRWRRQVIGQVGSLEMGVAHAPEAA